MLAASPLGQVVWTRNDSSGWAVRYYNYYPDTVPPTYPREGVFKSGSKKLDSGEWTSYMHPSFDFTGVRLLFVGDEPFSLGADGRISFSGNRLYWPDDDSPPLVSTAPGQAVLCPCMDHSGKFVYYTLFDYKRMEYVLMRHDMVNGGDQVLRDPSDVWTRGYTSDIAGLWPSISDNDRYVAFCAEVPGTAAVGLGVAVVNPDTGEVERTYDALPELPAGVPLDGAVRCSKAGWAPDGTFMVVCIQDDRTAAETGGSVRAASIRDEGRFRWRLYRIPLQGYDSGDLAFGEPELVMDSDRYDFQWPSVTADGRFCLVAATERGAQETRLMWIDMSASALLDDPVPGTESGVNLWPTLDRDNDPPNIVVRIVPSDSDEPVEISLVDVEPDPAPGTDTCLFHFKGAHLDEKMSTVFSPSTTMELSWEKNDYPPVLRVNFSADEEYKDEGQPEPNRPLKAFGTVDGDYSKVKGVYVEKDMRVKIRVLAKDNKFLRVTGEPEVDPAWFDFSADAADYRRTRDDGARNTAPPYLPLVSRERMENDKAPGVCWWLEDPNRQGGGSAVVERSDGNFHYIFRKANYPPERFPDHCLPYVIRVVAQDAWLNRVELTIPVYVWDSSLDVKTLEYESSRVKSDGGGDGR